MPKKNQRLYHCKRAVQREYDKNGIAYEEDELWAEAKKRHKSMTENEVSELNYPTNFGSKCPKRLNNSQKKKMNNFEFLQKIPQEDLLNYPFIFLSFNSYCSTVNPESEVDDYFPAEISCVQMTLKNGIERVMNVIFPCTKLPIGYASALKRSSEYHGINDEIDKNYYSEINPQKFWYLLNDFFHLENGRKLASIHRSMRSELGNFTDSNDPNFYQPFVLVRNEEVGVVRSMLSKMYSSILTKRKTVKYLNENKVCSLESLLSELYKKISNEMTTPIDAETILNDTRYTYNEGMQCKFHYDIDNLNCSLTKCRRYVFSICELICPKISDIRVTENHSPAFLISDSSTSNDNDSWYKTNGSYGSTQSSINEMWNRSYPDRCNRQNDSSKNSSNKWGDWSMSVGNKGKNQLTDLSEQRSKHAINHDEDSEVYQILSELHESEGVKEQTRQRDTEMWKDGADDSMNDFAYLFFEDGTVSHPFDIVFQKQSARLIRNKRYQKN
ncbi:hypothetical protein SNEBB_008085 [Seison nebaliae]|nr:hypothetical protein SNEBB_008085 [Seison nebaliae]